MQPMYCFASTSTRLRQMRSKPRAACTPSVSPSPTSAVPCQVHGPSGQSHGESPAGIGEAGVSRHGVPPATEHGSWGGCWCLQLQPQVVPCVRSQAVNLYPDFSIVTGKDVKLKGEGKVCGGCSGPALALSCVVTFEAVLWIDQA